MQTKHFSLVDGEVVNFDYSIRLVHAVKLALCDYCDMVGV